MAKLEVGKTYVLTLALGATGIIAVQYGGSELREVLAEVKSVSEDGQTYELYRPYVFVTKPDPTRPGHATIDSVAMSVANQPFKETLLVWERAIHLAYEAKDDVVIQYKASRSGIVAAPPQASRPASEVEKFYDQLKGIK